MPLRLNASQVDNSLNFYVQFYFFLLHQEICIHLLYKFLSHNFHYYAAIKIILKISPATSVMFCCDYK